MKQMSSFDKLKLTNHSLTLGGHSLEEQKKYRKMKRYWRLPLKYHYELNDVSFRKVPCFQKWQTERSIVDTLLSFDSIFKETYMLLSVALTSLQK